MPSALINGIRLYWQLTGQGGDAVVLVHGSWIDHRNWDGIVPALGRSFRVLTYDRRGHSQSERPAGQGSVAEDVADLGALIDHLGLGPAHILGNSFGGVIALRLAVEQPRFFRSLLVHEPPLIGLLDGRAGQQLLLGSDIPPRSVIDLLEQGQMEAGARLFYETIVRAAPGRSVRKRFGIGGSSMRRRSSTKSETPPRAWLTSRLWAASKTRRS